MRNRVSKRRLSVPARERQQGFTLVELMIALSIASILLMLAVPSMEDAAINAKLRSQANAFLASLHFARSEGIKRNRRVVVCKSASGTSCVADDGATGWEQGWIVFQDTNNDGLRSGDEIIIERNQALDSGFVLAGNDTVDDYVSFHPSGTTLPVGGGFQAGTLTLCRSTPTISPNGRRIIISSVGRMRIEAVDDLATCP